MWIWTFVIIMNMIMILQWSRLTGIGPGWPAVPWRRVAAYWTGCHHHHRANHHYNQGHIHHDNHDDNDHNHDDYIPHSVYHLLVHLCMHVLKW